MPNPPLLLPAVDPSANAEVALAMLETFRKEQAGLSIPSVYLSTLQSARSRGTAIDSFRRLARALQLDTKEEAAGRDPKQAWNAIPWEKIDFALGNMIRVRLAEAHSPTTANQTLSALRSVVRVAAMLGRIPFDQYLQVKAVAPVKGSRITKGRSLSLDEIRRLRGFCGTQPSPRDALLRGLFAVMFGAGLRREEVCSLRVYHFARERQGITVVGKGNKERWIPFDKGTAAELEIWLSTRKTLVLPHDFMFVSVRSDGRVRPKPITPWSLWDLLLNVGEDAGIEDFSPHDFRRTFAGQLLDAGVVITTVQKLMGHENQSTTAKYDRRALAEIERTRRGINLLGIEE